MNDFVGIMTWDYDLLKFYTIFTKSLLILKTILKQQNHTAKKVEMAPLCIKFLEIHNICRMYLSSIINHLYAPRSY